MPPVLRSRKLRRIIAAYGINRLGTWFGLLALLIATYDHTHSPLAVSALMFAALALPAFAVPPLVARVEASRRRAALARLYVFEALVTVALALLLAHFSLPVVLVLVAVDGSAALAATALLRAEVARAGREERKGTPARVDAEAVTPSDPDGMLAVPAGAADEEIRHEAEREANAALNIAFSLTFVLGPALGGAAVAGFGAKAALLIDAGSFLACASMLLDLSPHIPETGADTVRSRLASAWDHIVRVPWLRALFLAQLVAMMFIETGAPIEVPFVKSTLGAGDGGLGLVLAMWGAGAVAGSFGFARLLSRPLEQLLAGGTLLIGIAYLGLALSHSVATACAAGVVGGIGNSMQWPGFISTVQQLTPERLHGRLMGAVESLGAIALAVGLVLGGVLVTVSSTRTAFAIVGTLAALSSVLLGRVAAKALTDDKNRARDALAIHEATLASSELEESAETRRP
ncbi:MAG TPA: MFS transporter [Solirubrobacteraceae bacterium]|nr:MFS transporter [Solirubrobacteraceae bacterium]